MKSRHFDFSTPLSARSRVSILTCASLCAVATSAIADQTWTGASDALWTTSGNWNVAAPGAADVAIFNASSLANLATTLGGDRSILGLKVSDPAAPVSIAAGNTLTLGASGIDLSTSTQNLTLTNVTAVGAAQAWNVAADRILTVSGASSGTAAVTKSGNGTLAFTVPLGSTGGAILSGGNTSFAIGNFFNAFSGGLVEFRNGASLSTALAGGITFGMYSSVFVGPGQSGIINQNGTNRAEWGNTAGQSLTGSGSLTFNLNGDNDQRSDIRWGTNAFAGNIIVNGTAGADRALRLRDNGGDWNGFTAAELTLKGDAVIVTTLFTGGGTYGIGALSGDSATATLFGSNTGGVLNWSIGSRNQDTVYAGRISGNAAVTKVGTGTLTLGNIANDYSGTTAVNEGTLKITGAKTGLGTTTVNSGGTLTGTGTLAGTTSIANGGILAPGDGGIGNFTTANLTLLGGSVLNLQFGAGNDTATVSAGGSLNLSSGATVNVNGFSTDGVYNIINITGAGVVGTPSTALTAVNGSGGKVYSFSATADAVRMTISGSDPTNYWNVDGGGTWNLAGNWKANAIPNASGAFARVGPGVGGLGGSFTPADFTITMDATRTVGTLVFDDANTAITIDPGASGSLSFDNGASASVLTNVAGNNVINAPVAADADDLSVDVNDTYSLTMNGTVSGSGAALAKAGLGALVLAGDNTFNGGTTLSSGVISINSATSLGNVSGALTFSGGTLRLTAALAGITRSYQVTGANNALIDTNGNDFGYDGVISPVGGATGGLTKSGVGALTLTAAQTYTGTTTLTGGGLNLNTGGVINGAATNVSGGANFTVAGGSLTAGATSTLTGAAFNLSSGAATFNAGFNANTGNPNSNYLINLTGGTFSTSFLTMGRSATPINTPPAAGQNTVGLYINGAAAQITGALSLGNGSGSNSTVSARIDSGSLTVNGPVVVQINSPDRWSILDVNGGTFTSTDTVTGVQIGSGQPGSNVFLVRAGSTTVERVFLTQPAASTRTSRLSLSGGSLDVGAGGIAGSNNGGAGVLDIQLGTATLGAKASWESTLAMSLTGTTTIRAADAVGTPFNIGLSGAVSGTGGFVKTGGGTLTLSGTYGHAGSTEVDSGTLVLTTATLSNTAILDVSATGSAVLNLPHGQIDTVSDFLIDGVSQGEGVFNEANTGGRITGTGSIKVGGDPFADWIDDFAVGGQTAKTDDPDNDGQTNAEEFGLDGNPASGAATGKVRSRIETVGADQALVITLPVRVGATFAGAPAKTATIDSLVYTIAGSNNLSIFDQGVTEIAVSAAGMPPLSSADWTYRTFRLNGAIGGGTPRGPKGFLNADVAVAP